MENRRGSQRLDFTCRPGEIPTEDEIEASAEGPNCPKASQAHSNSGQISVFPHGLWSAPLLEGVVAFLSDLPKRWKHQDVLRLVWDCRGHWGSMSKLLLLCRVSSLGQNHLFGTSRKTNIPSLQLSGQVFVLRKTLIYKRLLFNIARHDIKQKGDERGAMNKPGTSEIFASSVAVSFLDTSSKFSTRSGTSSSSSSSMLLAASMAPPTPAPPTLLASLFRWVRDSAPSWFKIPGSISVISEGRNVNS